jgi:Family of unknown function (DUF6535)
MDVVQDILIYQTHMMRNSSLGPYSPSEFSPPTDIIIVNALFYASLGIMLLAAFIAMLIKSWVREFDRHLSRMSIPEQRAKTREFRNQGVLLWKLPEMVALLPFLIQLSLLLFSIGLVVFLFGISNISCGITTAILGIGVLFYAITTSISITVTSSPFRSPLSRSLGGLYRRIHALLYPTLEGFSSKEMDTSPSTRNQTWRHQIQVFLRTSRPYPEGEFVKPIADALGDTTQLRISTAALEWLHNTAPNSEYSEQTHWSVWITAGTPAFLVPPLLRIPYWIGPRSSDPDYLAGHSVEDVRALYSVLLRYNHGDYLQRLSLYHCLRASGTPWDTVIVEIDQLLYFIEDPVNSQRATADIIVQTIKRNQIQTSELLWLLELLSDNRIRSSGPARAGWYHRTTFIDICVAIMWTQGSGSQTDSRDLQKSVLVDTTITFAALVLLWSYTVEIRQAMLTQRRQCPWLLPSLRNKVYIVQMVAAAHGSKDASLIFSTNRFLFLVALYLIRQDSPVLAREYIDIIVRDDDFLSWTPILAATAPVMTTDEITAMTRLLMVEPDHRAQVPLQYSRELWSDFHKDVLQRYDASLGETGEPDPYLLVALLYYDPFMGEYKTLLSSSPFKNPWWNLAMRAMFSFGTPVGSSVLPNTCQNAKIFNIVAAKCLIHYEREDWDGEPELGILELFLQSREFIITSLSLRYYIQEFMGDISLDSNGSSLLQSLQYLDNAVQVTFNSRLLEHQLLRGWSLLAYFMSKWEFFPSQWRRTFADAFFVPVQREFPRRRVTTLDNYPFDELEALIRWDYAHDQGEEVGSGSYDGIDWFLAIWPYAARKDDPDYGPDSIDPSSILQALGKLLAAATEEVVTPLFSRIREFILGISLQGNEISDVRERILAQIVGKVHPLL